MIKLIDRMIIKQFFPTLLVAILFFVLILEMVDLFANLWRYINNEVTILSMLRVFVYYIPKCINLSLPMALLFSVSYTLGNFYANNELIAIFGSGISLFRFALPLVIIGLLLSFGSFYFEEKLVIDTFKIKNEQTNLLLNRSKSLNNTHPTFVDNKAKTIYNADFYNDKDRTLSNVIVIEKDEEGRLVQTIHGEWADWDETNSIWVFHRCRQYLFNNETEELLMKYSESYTNEIANAPPFNFQKIVNEVEEMRLADAKRWIESLKKAGLPYNEALTTYYKRFSFSLTPFIVCLLSSAIGGRFRKNILLMSLLSSLIVSVVFYVMQMIFTIFANLNYLSPAAGAWIPFIIFCFIGFILYRLARA